MKIILVEIFNSLTCFQFIFSVYVTFRDGGLLRGGSAFAGEITLMTFTTDLYQLAVILRIFRCSKLGKVLMLQHHVPVVAEGKFQLLIAIAS